MAAWLPLLKASLPYVTQIVTAALPVFTPKAGKPDSKDLIEKQVAELQAAVTQNAEAIRLLAAELKQTIEGIAAAGQAQQQEIKALRRLVAASSVTAILAAGMAIWALLRTSTLLG